jgi:RND family efflux transporter MFP subunit
MLRQVFLVVIAITLSACSKGPEKADKSAATANERPLLIAAEDLLTVRNTALASGPSITGSVQPERRADLRAEVSAVVLQVLKENGDNVRRGDVLVRMDDTSIRESLASAEAATRAASQSFEQAERQFQRMTTLRKSGMTSTQQLEDAEIRRNNAQSDLEAAKTRAVQARQQLQRTEVRAPFDGIVSDRKVSAGDTAQIGKELVKVIDPASMRFEGLVSADSIGSVQAGQPVHFRVNGYGDQEFTGKVRRVNPAANATTRQVEVLVDFVDKKQPRLAGLYAEGRIETESTTSLTIPATALVRDGDKSAAWRLKNNTLQKVSLDVGDRDSRSGDFVLKGGLAEGDRLIRYPSATLKDGQKVELAAAPGAATKAAAIEKGK